MNRMSKIAITAEQFKNKATRYIDIPGFDESEEITVLIKPVSILQMMNKGIIANELLGVAAGLFDDSKQAEIKPEEILNNKESINALTLMMDNVCKEVLVQPKFDEIAEYLTDAQKQSIFEQAAGTKQFIPSDRE